MYAICVESSHRRGMGHLFRAIAFCDFLKKQGLTPLILINEDEVARTFLSSGKVAFEVVDVHELSNDWETEIIRKHGVTVWINDRLDTEYQHAQKVKNNNVGLVTFDDRGGGAELADIHIAGLVFSGREELKGKEVLAGKDYLILSREIDMFKRLRKDPEKILVTLGGSDTYGATVDVVQILEGLDMAAAVHIGPSFAHRKALSRYSNDRFKILDQPSSLIRTMAEYDLAITGGGVTPFEANASGLPCLTISNEEHEREVCAYLHELGGSHYLGHRNDLTRQRVRNALARLDIPAMSEAGMRTFSTLGAERILRHLRRL